MPDWKRDARRAAAMRQSPQHVPRNANMGAGGAVRQVGVQAVYQVGAQYPLQTPVQPNPESTVAAVIPSTAVVPYQPAPAAKGCSASNCKFRHGDPVPAPPTPQLIPKREIQVKEEEIPTQLPELPSPAQPCTPEALPSVAIVHWNLAKFPPEPIESIEAPPATALPARFLGGGLASPGGQPPCTRSRTLAELRLEVQKLEEENAALKKGYTVLNCCWRRVLQIHLKEAEEKLPELEKKISAAL